MIGIELSAEITDVCPDLNVLAVSCKIAENTPSDENLWKEIAVEEDALRTSLKVEDINKFAPIYATRQAYKKLGKDPNRYRPSAEALRRRVLKGMSLYRIDTLVDLINLVSLKTGYSIGGFDSGKINGNLILGVGKEGEVYHGIGRGELNIAGLPVYRDLVGGIGTPTSDEERTKIGMETKSLLMIINGYSGREGLFEAGKYSLDLLRRYLNISEIEVNLITKEGKTECKVDNF